MTDIIVIGAGTAGLSAAIYGMRSGLIRQRLTELTLICESPAEPADLLIGAGAVRRAEVAWVGYAVAGLGYNFRRCIEEGIPRRVEMEEYSNYGMSL